MVPHKKTFLDVKRLAAKRTLGGISLSNVNLHCQIMLIRNVMLYIKQKCNGENLSEALYYIEYNLGHQLYNMWGLEIDNLTPHRFCPNQFYAYVPDILKMVKHYGVTKDDIYSAVKSR